MAPPLPSGSCGTVGAPAPGSLPAKPAFHPSSLPAHTAQAATRHLSREVFSRSLPDPSANGLIQPRDSWAPPPRPGPSPAPLPRSPSPPHALPSAPLSSGLGTRGLHCPGCSLCPLSEGHLPTRPSRAACPAARARWDVFSRLPAGHLRQPGSRPLGPHDHVGPAFVFRCLLRRSPILPLWTTHRVPVPPSGPLSTSGASTDPPPGRDPPRRVLFLHRHPCSQDDLNVESCEMVSRPWC